jgi:hypothetical protein
VTLTLMPSAIASAMAGRPSTVAGILMSRFGRSTVSHSRFAIVVVRAVSRAAPGSTSIETRPSTPSVRSWTGRSTSHASRTSVVVRAKTVSSTSAPAAFSSATWAA